MKEKRLTISFVIILGLLSLINLLAPTTSFSAKENRYLQQFPALSFQGILSNAFSSDFEIYASDQFIARDKWISLKTLSERMILKKDNGRVYFGHDGYLFDIDEPIDQSQFDRNMKNINSLLRNVYNLDEGLIVNALMIPTKSTVFNNKLPLHAPILDETALFHAIEEAVNERINLVDLNQRFQRHPNEKIYYKTDHHWTSLGAYYAYSELLQEQAISQNSFEVIEVSDNFLGTTYRKANFYLDDPDTIEKYTSKKQANIHITVNQQEKRDSLYVDGFLDKTDQYAYFMGGDQALIEITTGVKEGKNLLVLKDSFANSLIPFLTNHYKNIYVIDSRYYNGSIKDFVRDSEIDELLLLYNIQNFVREPTFSKLAN